MSRKLDITNKKFGRLKAISVNRTNGKSHWLCKCDCGKNVIIGVSQLTTGQTKSCGCLQREILGNIRRTHGFSGNRFYSIYKGIGKRCNNPKEPNYKNYGGRGIKRLWKSFEEFKDDMYKSYLNHVKKFGAKDTMIERKDNNGDYCEENCIWATKKIQNNNRRNNHFLTYKGKEMTIAEWSEYLGITQSVLYRRSGLGWSINRMFNQPVRL